MSLRANYGKQFNAQPSFGIFLLKNHLPKLPADDNAVWERVHVFKFTEYIKPEERNEVQRDRTQDARITGEAVLAWLVERWRLYRIGGRVASAKH